MTDPIFAAPAAMEDDGRHTYALEPPPLRALEPAPALELEGQSLGTEGGVAPTEGPQDIELTELERTDLYNDIEGVLIVVEQAMRPRLQVQKEIEEAYDLAFDPKRGGTHAGASQLCSELTRDHVNQVFARQHNAIFGLRPLCSVSVGGEDVGDKPTEDLLNQAKSIERFLDSYKDVMEVPRVLAAAMHRSSKVGGSWIRILWEGSTRRYRVADAQGRPAWQRRERGKVAWRLIRNQDHILWPLDVLNPQDAMVAGHDSYLTPAEFRQWALRHEIDPNLAQRVIDAARGESDESSADDLQRKNVDVRGSSPTDGEICLTELWCNMPLPASYHTRTGTEPAPFQVFISKHLREVLRVGWNPLYCQLHPYFYLPYWQEDGCVLATGVGHEVRANQRLGSSLLNMLMDNMRVVGAHVVAVKEGSTAEQNLDTIAPGGRVVVDDVDDLKAFALGGELTNIYQAISFNEQSARRNSGVSDIFSGRGDTNLKSGATATAVTTLATEGGKKFAAIDEGVKKAIGEMFSFCLLLLQQYAPSGIYYEHVSETDAMQMERLRFIPPTGDLSTLFRIRARGPSAATNQDVQKQNVLILLNQSQQLIQTILGLSQQAWAMTNPAGIMRLTEESMVFMADFMKRVLVLHDVVDLKPPHPGGVTPMEQVASQLMLQLQQFQQQLEQVGNELAMAKAENAELRQFVPVQAMQGVGPGAPASA